MQTRSFRGSGEPAWVIASSNACEGLGPDPRRALGPAATRAASTGRTHDRTRPVLHQRKKALVNEAPSTHDPKQICAPVRILSVASLRRPVPAIAADDVAAIVADVALAAPRSGIVEIAGPERAPFNEIIARYLKAIGEPREVVRDPETRYWGGRVEEYSLVPLGEACLGRIGFDEWLRRSQAAA